MTGMSGDGQTVRVVEGGTTRVSRDRPKHDGNSDDVADVVSEEFVKVL
jgi:hypothetical protein